MRRVAEAQTEWAMGFIEAGVDGLFYSGQFSEPGRFTDEEFDLLVKEGDLTILRAAESKGARNILHICGEPDYNYVSTPPATPNTPVLSPTGPSRTPASPSPRAESSSAASPFSAA